MSKQKKKNVVSAKLLDLWSPPEGAGFSVGCVATTFTFNPVFFEEECLGRFLQMQSDAIEDGPVYIIEREEKLADIRCASVLVDASHCKGQRSLRWDLLAARVPGAILHAKVSLLWWQNCVRLIVASANLTEDGYRRNREIFGAVDYAEGGKSPLLFLYEMISFLRDAVSHAEPESDVPSPALSRWRGFLNGVLETTRGWGSAEDQKGKKATRIHAILTGPGRIPALEQIADFWPEGSPPIDAIVTSPFFDPSGAPNSPAKFLWKSLRQRGEASITYNVTAKEVEGDSRLYVNAPKEIMYAQPNRKSVETYIFRVYEQEEEKSGIHRPLHMKGIWFSGNSWMGYLIGSGNFTSRGLGLNKHPNIEAGILYLASGSGNPAAAKRLRGAVPEGDFLHDIDSLQFKENSETGEDAPDKESISLPHAFGQAVYAGVHTEATVQFLFEGVPPAGWRVFKFEGSDEILLDETHWSDQGKPEKVILSWDLEMAPSGFEVSWHGVSGRAWWPVNVDRAASLPPPKELKDLPLEVLVNILTSARPLYQVMKLWDRKKKGKDPDNLVPDPYDPHKRVDTSGFLLQKTYRVASALSGLRSRLERPVASEDSLEWRLKGPVGVYAVANAITKEARSDDEQVFLVTELALEILRSQPRVAAGYLSAETVKKEIQKVALDLKKQAFDKLGGATGSMAEYVESAFKGILE